MHGDNFESMYDISVKIAKKAINTCITESGIVAGSHHFVDLWARDSLFASFGAPTEVAKKTIEAFLKYQRRDGLIPYLILRSRHNIGKYFGKQIYFKTPVPQFRSHLTFGTVPDGGILTIIAMRKYIESTGDISFLKKNYKTLLKAFSWYKKKFGTHLISEWFSCEWADALLKIGETLYTNVLYYKSARDLSWIAGLLKKPNDKALYEKIATRISSQIHHQFWTGQYFADWIDWKRQDYFATHPNMLAIVFGLTTKKESDAILKHAKSTVWNGRTVQNSNPRYPWWRISLLHMVIGMSDYHNGMLWLQPGILYATALQIMKKQKEARCVFKKISEKIVEYNGVYEVYEKNGKPVKRLFYQSEYPFAWSAGLYLWAYQNYFFR